MPRLLMTLFFITSFTFMSGGHHLINQSGPKIPLQGPLHSTTIKNEKLGTILTKNLIINKGTHLLS